MVRRLYEIVTIIIINGWPIGFYFGTFILSYVIGIASDLFVFFFRNDNIIFSIL